MAGTVVTLGSDTFSAKSLRERYAVSDEDQACVSRFGETQIPKLDAFVDAFYTWLEPQPYYEEFFPDQETNQRVRKLMRGYWQEFFTRDLDDAYVRHRQVVGQTHARIGLSLDAYFAAMNHALHLWTVQLHGGAGYMDEYRISRMYTDARISRIYAGSSEVMREIIARGIGLDPRKKKKAPLKAAS